MATAIGTVIEGKYEILKQIGQGGMSIVYLAMDKHLNKQWAVKEIKKTANGKNEEVVVNSLITEANLMKRLDHPALPRIVDIIDNGQTIYIVMDYIEGESLDKVLREYGAQAEKDVVNWAIQICDALNYLHSQKPPIIYRDMKPANVMLKPEGNVKIIDFGIAREYKGTSLSDTVVLGTRGYASPEHYGTSETDPRSDIYTLGMTMHHLLTGIDPRTPGYVYAPVRQWNPELSEGVEEIINKCTQIDPINRYQNCDELMYDLQHPDQIGKGIRKKKKRRLVSFAVMAILAVVFAVLGTLFYFLMINENENNYEANIAIHTVESCFDAMEIDGMGGETSAYFTVIEIFEEQAEMSAEDYSKLNNYFNTNKSELQSQSDYADLLFELGEVTFYYYESGESDESGSASSLRARSIEANKFFSELLSLEESDSAVQSDSKFNLATSYYQIGKFYSDYVNNKAATKEPSEEDYQNMLDAIEACISEMDGYDDSNSDKQNILLNTYYAFANFINSYASAMANNNISQQDVEACLENIKDRASNIEVTIESNIQLKAEIIKACADYLEVVERAYQNAASARTDA